MKQDIKKDERLIAISKLPVNTLPSELKKPAASFQRQALNMRKLPLVVSQYEEKIHELAESIEQPSQESLVRVLLDSSAMDLVVDYHATTAEVNLAQTRLERLAGEVIAKSTRGNRQASPAAEKLADTMIGVLDVLDFVDPFGSLPGGSPTLEELAGANSRINGDAFGDFSPRSMAVQSRIPKMFQPDGTSEQMLTTAFLASLAIGQDDAIEGKRALLRSNGVSAETIQVLKGASTVMEKYMWSTLYDLEQVANGGRAMSQNPDGLHRRSHFPVALATYATIGANRSTKLPSSIDSVMKGGLIRGLNEQATDLLTSAYKSNFLEENRQLLQLADADGFRPYQVLVDRFDVNDSLDWLNNLAPHYPLPDNSNGVYWEFFLESGRARAFLKDRLLVVPGDERIPKIFAGNSGNGIDILMMSKDLTPLALQLRTWGPSALEVSGIPGGYVKEAAGFVGNIFERVLSTMREEGYLNTPYQTYGVGGGGDSMRQIVEETWRGSIPTEGEKTDSGKGKSEIKISLPQVSKDDDVEVDTPLRQKRFSISDPTDVVGGSGLSEEEVKALLDEIDSVEHSDLGTYPMVKMKGYKGDLRRIRVKKLVTTPNGKKSRINLRAVVEFEGTSGEIVKVSNRGKVYEELDRFLR